MVNRNLQNLQSIFRSSSGPFKNGDGQHPFKKVQVMQGDEWQDER